MLISLAVRWCVRIYTLVGVKMWVISKLKQIVIVKKSWETKHHNKKSKIKNKEKMSDVLK